MRNFYQPPKRNSYLSRFPHFDIKKGSITDEDIRKKIDGYSTVSADILIEEKKNEDIRNIRRQDKIRENQDEITEEEKMLLIDVLENLVSGVAERYKRLSFSVYKGNKIRDSLICKGLLRSNNISTFEGWIRLLDITEKGENVLRKIGHKIEKKREGGPEHEYWKYRIAKFLRSKGYQIEIEKPIGKGKAVDIVTTKDVETIAIEIETG